MLEILLVLHFLRHMVGCLSIFCACFDFFSHFFFCFFVGGGDEIISGLSFVGIICEDALFLNGLAVHQIWSQVFFSFSFLFDNLRIYC